MVEILVLCGMLSSGVFYFKCKRARGEGQSKVGPSYCITPGSWYTMNKNHYICNVLVGLVLPFVSPWSVCFEGSLKEHQQSSSKGAEIYLYQSFYHAYCFVSNLV